MTHSTLTPLSYLLACLLLSLLAYGPATAQTHPTPACGNWQPKQLPSQPQEWQAEYLRLNPRFMQCLHDADFLAYFGGIELRTGRIESALDTLERALLLNPQHGAAQMDYAQVLYYTGDPFAAQALNQHLLNQNNLPPQIKAQITSNQKKLHQQLNTLSHQISLNSGYDSNLNTSPSLNQLTLTLDGEDWVLALAQNLKPHSGPVLRLGLSSRYTQRQANHSKSYEVSLNSRLSEHSQDQQHQLSLRFNHQQKRQNAGQLNHRLSLIGLQHGQKHTYTTLEAQQSWQTTAQPKQTPNCQHAAQHTLGYQNFTSRSDLNALEYRLTPQLNCDLNNNQLSLATGIMYNHGLNATRAGGQRWGTELTLNWQRPLPQGRLQLQARYTLWQDTQGYNPTLNNNAKRQVKRQQYTLAYLLPLKPNLLLTSQAALQRQKSNLPLFEFRSYQLDLGIKWQF